jgi:hypothetical protein
MCPFCGREKKGKEKRSKRGMEMDLIFEFCPVLIFFSKNDRLDKISISKLRHAVLMQYQK